MPVMWRTNAPCMLKFLHHHRIESFRVMNVERSIACVVVTTSSTDIRCAQLPHLAGLANTIIGKEIRMKPNSGATKRSMNNQLDVELQLTDLGEEQQ